jgi:hypothetical protein
MAKQLFLVDGMSGIWKEDFVRYARETLVDITVVSKISTRQARIGEDLEHSDLSLVTPIEFDRIDPDFTYTYADARYGIRRTEIKRAFAKADRVFLIVRNASLISRLRREFSKYTPVALFVFMDAGVVAKRSELEHHAAIKSSVFDARDDYLRTPGTYDDVIVYCDDAHSFFRTLDAHLAKHADTSRPHLNGVSNHRVLLLTSKPTRRLLQAVTAVIGALGAGAGAVLFTSESAATKVVAGLIAILLLTISIAAEYLLATGWREIRKPSR